jgi:hypothetical protein
MEEKKPRTRYLYQATAVATSGRVTRPFQDQISAQASLALPIGGGYEAKRAESYRYKEILSFASAYSEVAGSAHGPDGPFDTLALTAIEKLNILDVVTCDRLVARISSKRTAASDEPEITTVGARFERLRIGSHFFEELDLGVGVLAECKTWTELRRALDDGKKRDICAHSMLSAPNGDALPLPDGDNVPRVLGFSLAPGAGRSAGVKAAPWKIEIPQVGTVYLGEIYVSQYTRQLLMLRVELGCPVAGGLDVGSSGISGDSFPP